jgi:hydroxymethylpyrimidine pyrophosphatase-like HAD family hydrolase/nucleoside-triphosphatase THEP1
VERSKRDPGDGDRSGAHRGRIVFLIGGPGAGKTITCRRVVGIARRKDLRVAGLLSESRELASGRIVQTVVSLRTGERRRLAEYVGPEEGEPIGRGVAGRFSWQFVSESVRWGRHELERCASGSADLLVIDQLGPLELVAGSGWSNAIEVLATARFGTALVAVNPLVLDELRARAGMDGAMAIDVTETTRELLPEYLAALAGWSTIPGHPLLASEGPDCLVADLDGTLLDSAGDPSAPGIVAGLREVDAAGITFVICTGRPTDSAHAAARALGARRGYVIAYGGAETSDVVGGQVLSRVAMPADVSAAVLEASCGLGLAATPHDSPAGVVRVVLCGDGRRIERAVPALRESVGDAVCFLRPSEGVLAVQAGTATKQVALAALVRRLRVRRKAVAYLGDAVDDAPALRWAGLGIGVAGHSPEAEAAADVVAPRELVPEMLTRLALARRLRTRD